MTKIDNGYVIAVAVTEDYYLYKDTEGQSNDIRFAEIDETEEKATAMTAEKMITNLKESKEMIDLIKRYKAQQ